MEGIFCPQDGPFTCITIYYVKQSDMDAGSTSIISSVTSKNPNGTMVEDIAYRTVQLQGQVDVFVGECFTLPSVAVPVPRSSRLMSLYLDQVSAELAREFVFAKRAPMLHAYTLTNGE